MNIVTLHLGIVAFVGEACTAAFGGLIQNSPFLGPTGVNTVASAWQAAHRTPDTADASSPFKSTGLPWTASPDGASCVRSNGTADNRAEAISQPLTEIVPGQSPGLSQPRLRPANIQVTP
jgi:hypothetical protein